VPEPAERTTTQFATIVGLIGTILTFIAAKGHLPGIGNDAASYVAIADRLANGGSLGYFLEPKLGLWPPGFPAVLAVPRWILGVGPEITALWINAFALVPLAWTTRWLVVRVGCAPRTQRAGILIAVLGPATLSQSYMAQTEITFVLLVLWSFVALIRFCDTGHRSWFVWGVLAQWAAFMDRYVGLVAIGAGALWLALERVSDRPAGARFARGVAFFVASCALPGAWILRNVVVTDTPFGPRDSPIATIASNTVDAATSLGQYLHGFARYAPMIGVGRLASLVLAAAVGLVALGLTRRVMAARDTRADSWRRLPTGIGDLIGHPAGLLTIYGIAHWAYMIYSASTIAFDPVNTRYLVPMFIPLLVVGMALLQRGALDTVSPTGARVTGLTKLVAMTLPLLVVLQVGMGLVRVSASYWTDDAQGYSSPKALAVRESPVLDSVPGDCDRRYSNFPELTYLAGFEAQRSPRRTKVASSDELRELEDLQEHVADGGSACLIWVDDDRFATPLYQWQLDELGDRLELIPLDQDRNVAVYRVGPSS